ncbi:MAG: hypothetical protein WC781_05170 [Candidatus Pacearchaeota archaeon]|jgi:type II secretory pathway pseudopilin PulG
MRKIKTKKAQVWVETVVYTLIGLVLIGALLAFVTPAIEKQKDKTIISKTIEAMSELDNNILDVKRNGAANVKTMTLSISKGTFIILGENDTIKFQIDDSSYSYSQLNYDIKIPGSNQVILTQKNGNKFKVTITLDYRNKINLTYNSKDQTHSFTKAPSPYAFSIENNGAPPDKLTNINIYESG